MALVKKFFVIVLLVFGTSSCFQEYQDLRRGEEYIRQGNYKQAIGLFNKYESKKSRQLNSIAHRNYAVAILTDLGQEKGLRYKNAKLILRKALDLDPSNQSAKAFYKMLSKSMETELVESLE